MGLCPAEEVLKERVAFKFLRQYLEDRLIADLRRDMGNSAFTPVSPSRLLQVYAETASAIATIQPSANPLPFPPGWADDGSSRIEKVPLGQVDFDDFLSDGLGCGEVLGLLAPHGTCKTLLAIQFGCDWAIAQADAWEATAARQSVAPCVYVFAYEGSVAEMRTRAICHTGEIDKDRLELGDPAENLNRTHLLPYERDLFADRLRRGESIPSERDRSLTAKRKLNRNFRVIDMTGNDPENPGRGWGMVDEIAAIIQADIEFYRRQGMELRIGGVIVDYAGAAVERYIDMAPKVSRDHFRNLLGKFPMHFKSKVAQAFNCPGIINHQLNADANALAPGALPKGTDSAECRTFRENLDFAIVLSNPTSQNLVTAGLDKKRRGPSRPPRVLEIDGRFGTVRTTNGEYVYDAEHRRIVDRESLRGIMDPGQMQSHFDADDEQTAWIRAGGPAHN